MLRIFSRSSSCFPRLQMTTAHSETDHAIALALDQRRQSEEDAQDQQFFDESLARILQDDEIDHTDAGLHLSSLEPWVNKSACSSCCYYVKHPQSLPPERQQLAFPYQLCRVNSGCTA